MVLLLAVLLAIADAWITHRRLSQHIKELNPLVSHMLPQLGTALSSLLGVFGVQVLVAVILSIYTPTGLAMMVGASLYRTWTQLYSMKYLP